MSYGYIILNQKARLRLERVLTIGLCTVGIVMMLTSPIWLTLDFIAERRSRKAQK